VFENRVLRRIFKPKRFEVTGEWREVHNEIRNFYSSPDIIRQIKSRRMGWAGHMTHVRGEKQGDGLDGEARIRMARREIGWRGMEWIQLAQNSHQRGAP
jgi:hypothetical protein